MPPDEQRPQPSVSNWYLTSANYSAMYLLAALEPGRTSVQILHENDNCCFRGAGIHSDIIRYDDAIATALATTGMHGVFTTAVTDWPIHMISPREKDVIAEGLRRSIVAARTRGLANFTGLPCDMLNGGSGSCHEGPVPPPYAPPSSAKPPRRPGPTPWRWT